jgi:hypothetical protein
VSNNEIINGFRPTFAYNSDRSQFFMILYLSDTQRLLVPISTENAIVQTVAQTGYTWHVDNLSTIEYHAKQKGLV